MLPVSQEAAQVTPRRDPLEGLVGGLLFAQNVPPMTLVEQQEPAAASQPEPEQQRPVTAMAQVPPAQPSDVCVRHGLHRVYYNQNNHRYWRCAGRR
jgi:hypothetical protein